jgi:lipopolysaccharide/colanic/teichoic acid biosynthesis glycosyltransferase
VIGFSDAVRVSGTARDVLAPDRQLLVGRFSDRRLLQVVLAVLDVMAVGLAALAAGLLRLRLDGIILPIDGLTPGYHFLASVLLIPVLLGLLWAHGLYDPDQILVGTREYSQVAHAATYGILIALAASYFAGNSQFVSRAWLVLVWAFCTGSLCLGRFGARRVVRHLRRRGWLRTRVVIVGASTFGIAIARQLCEAVDEGLDVVGFLDEYVQVGSAVLDSITVVGRPDDLLAGGTRRIADEFILVPQALPYERQEEISRLMASRSGPVLRVAVSSTELVTHGVRVTARGNVPLVAVQSARIRGMESVWKRTFDLVGASLALVVLSPIVIVVLARAYLVGRRPLLRRYPICGTDGPDWGLWLFNSRVVNWPLLRGTPALAAVVRGNLSLVGPRPVLCHTGDEFNRPTGLIAVKPGLTGPWRLTGAGGSVAEQTLQDLNYVRNYSIWEDAHILMDSVRRLLGGGLPDMLGRWHLDPDLPAHRT